MNDDDAAAIAPTIAADNADDSWVPTTDKPAFDFAWSVGDEGDAVAYDRHPWDSAWGRAVLIVGGATAVALLIGVGGLIMTLTHRDGRIPAAQPSTVILQTSVLELPAPPPVTKTVTVRASPTTVTVQAPPTVSVEAAPPSVKIPATTSTGPTRAFKNTTPSRVDSSNDQRFLDTLRALGYTVGDPQAALRNAHETCRMFQLSESADQVNQQLRAKTGAPMNDITQFTSSVMLSYPDCVRVTTASGVGNN